MTIPLPVSQTVDDMEAAALEAEDQGNTAQAKAWRSLKAFVEAAVDTLRDSVSEPVGGGNDGGEQTSGGDGS